jgi:integrase
VKANQAWADAGLAPLGLHEARHCYASLLLAGGFNIKQVQTYMGHASVGITLDRYAHLMPDDTEQAVAQLDEVLA